jgi:ATP synthase in type III secretion protein N
MKIDGALRETERATSIRVSGPVTELVGLAIRAQLPGVRVGEVCLIEGQGEPLFAEVVGFRGDETILLPLGEPRGIGPDSVAVATRRPLSIRCGEALLGRVLDGLGRPIDGIPMPDDLEDWSVHRAAPDPLSRARVVRPLALGVRAIDGLLTLGEGQRIGVFSAPGAGKSALLGQIARHTAADVTVIALVGERGREVREFVEESLGADGLRRAVVVCATSDAPSLVRQRSAVVATAVAEFFRERGRRVLLLMDSLTRFARAQREVGLAAGEAPARQGYPPSVFAALPALVERAGNSAQGSITAIYTVLVAGDEADDPVADEARAVLDGHIVLSADLGARNHWPAIDVLRSLSRVMDALVTPEHRAAAARVRAILATHARQRDLVLMGAYRPGSDPATDEALERIADVERFLRQAPVERADFAATRGALLDLVG